MLYMSSLLQTCAHILSPETMRLQYCMKQLSECGIHSYWLARILLSVNLKYRPKSDLKKTLRTPPPTNLFVLFDV